MLTKQLQLKSLDELTAERLAPVIELKPQLLFLFAASKYFRDPALAERLTKLLPNCERIGCSTSGEITMQSGYEDSISLTALRFDDPAFTVVTTELQDMDDSMAAGGRISAQLRNSLPHTVLLFAPGTDINGSRLVEGLIAASPKARIAGGLAGDGLDFKSTFTLCNNRVSPRQIVAVAFTGENIVANFGSYGGWRPFGPVRRVTRAASNVLFELDGEPALDVYKRYLGKYASQLPASAFLFPFSILNADRQEVGLIRTILKVNESDGSLTLAGNVHDNGFLQLMNASTDALVNGAATSAAAAHASIKGQGFGMMISCVGRKLAMGGRNEEELEAVIDELGSNHAYAGFYSYGEISPGSADVGCSLYNQTMAVTFLGEK
jgi:hypothetical protein